MLLIIALLQIRNNILLLFLLQSWFAVAIVATWLAIKPPNESEKMKNYTVKFYDRKQNVVREQTHSGITASKAEFQKHIQAFMNLFVRDAANFTITEV